MDQMSSCVFTKSVDRCEDDSPPVCLVELVNSKTKVTDTHEYTELCSDKSNIGVQENGGNNCTVEEICPNKTCSSSLGFHDFKSKSPLPAVISEDKSDGLSNTILSNNPSSISTDLDNSHLSTMKESSSLICNQHTQSDNESLTTENCLRSEAKITPCDRQAEDEDDLDFEDRPLTVDTQESDDILLNEPPKKIIPLTNNSVYIVPNSMTEDKQDPTTSTTIESKTSFIATHNTPSSVVCLSSSPSPCQSTLSAQSSQSISIPNKNCSSDGHQMSTPVALATVAPIRMSSMGPDYSVSNEVLRPVKPAPQDIQLSTVMSNHTTPQTVTSIFPNKHEMVSTTSSVSYNSKSSNHSRTNERSSFSPISVTKSTSVGTTSMAVSTIPTTGSSVMTTHSMSNIFNVRTRPSVAQSVLPVLSVGPQPTPSLTSQTSLPSIQSQSTVHFMPFVSNMPVSASSTGLRNIINHSQTIPIAGTPTAPCAPLQIFNMTPMPQFMGTPSYVLHPTGPVPGANSFQFPQGSTHLLPGLSGGAGVGGAATFNFLQPQNYPSTIFPQPPTMSDVLIDPQNPMGLGHSILTPPSSITLISAINNPSSSSFTSIYPTLLHPPNQNFFQTSSTHSGPVSYPYSTALAAGTNLVNATAPQMATSLVPAGVTNLPNIHNSNETSFMFQSGPPPHGTSFISSNFTPNPGQLFPPYQFPTFPNLFQTNDTTCLTATGGGTLMMSSSLPTDFTPSSSAAAAAASSTSSSSSSSTCDTTKSSFTGAGASGASNGLSTYWPYIVSTQDLMHSTSLIQVSSNATTIHQTDFLQSVNSNSNHMNNNNVNDGNVKTDDCNNNNNNLTHHETINGESTITNTITTTSTNAATSIITTNTTAAVTTTTNPLIHAPINSLTNTSFSSINTTTAPPTTTTSNITSTLTNNNNNNIHNYNQNKNNIMLSNSSTIVLPAIRRRRRLFAQNGIRPITNVIQSPFLNHTNSLNDESNNSTVMNSTGGGDDDDGDETTNSTAAASATASDSQLSVKVTPITNNNNNNNNSIDNDMDDTMNNSISNSLTAYDNELKQSDDIQSSNTLTHITNSSTTTMLTLKRNNTTVQEESVENLQLSSQISTDVEFTSKLSKEKISVMTTTTVTTQLTPTLSSINMTSYTTVIPSPVIITSPTISPNCRILPLDAINTHNLHQNTDGSVSSASPSNPNNNNKWMYTNSNCIQKENKILLSIEDENGKDTSRTIINHQMKLSVSNTSSPINNIDQKDVVNCSKLSSPTITTTSSSCSAVDSKLKSTITPFHFPPPPVLIGPDDRRILTHYIDGHIIYESDKPFPVKNGMELVEIALLKQQQQQQSCLVNSTNSSSSSPPPLKTFIVNGYEDRLMNTVKSSSSTTIVKSNDNYESDVFMTTTTTPTTTSSRLSNESVDNCAAATGGWINSLKVSNSSLSIIDKLTNHHSDHQHSMHTPTPSNMLLLQHYDTRRRKSSLSSNEQSLYNDIHDENDSLLLSSSTTTINHHYHRPTQGILASYPHSTILSLANRNSANVVYTQSPIVSIPSRNDKQSSYDILKGGNELTALDGKLIENYSQHHQYTESSVSLNKPPLNEIQSSSGIMHGGINPSTTCQQRLSVGSSSSSGNNSSIAQTKMYGISHQTVTSSSSAASSTSVPSSGLYTATPTPPPKGPIYKWTSDDVVAFVRGTPGCGAYASAFLNNEIDGEALLLLA
ncbi:unnamed protein product, partial [Schistosoma turkestanicum]